MDSGHHKRDHHGSRHTDTVSRSNKVMKQRERSMDVINEIIVAWDQQILLLMFHKQCGRQRPLDIVYEIIMSGGIQTLLLIFLKQWGTQSGLDVTNEIISVGGKQILFFIVLKQWVRVGLDSITVIVRAMGGCGGGGRWWVMGGIHTLLLIVLKLCGRQWTMDITNETSRQEANRYCFSYF